jgi:hypothetical protein
MRRKLLALLAAVLMVLGLATVGSSSPAGAQGLTWTETLWDNPYYHGNYNGHNWYSSISEWNVGVCQADMEMWNGYGSAGLSGSGKNCAGIIRYSWADAPFNNGTYPQFRIWLHAQDAYGNNWYGYSSSYGNPGVQQQVISPFGYNYVNGCVEFRWNHSQHGPTYHYSGWDCI